MKEIFKNYKKPKLNCLGFYFLFFYDILKLRNKLKQGKNNEYFIARCDE